ncbi:hypothetical protein Ahia01_000085700, partial [Argonauta hians]
MHWFLETLRLVSESAVKTPGVNDPSVLSGMNSKNPKGICSGKLDVWPVVGHFQGWCPIAIYALLSSWHQEASSRRNVAKFDIIRDRLDQPSPVDLSNPCTGGK